MKYAIRPILAASIALALAAVPALSQAQGRHGGWHGGGGPRISLGLNFGLPFYYSSYYYGSPYYYGPGPVVVMQTPPPSR